MNIDNNGYKFWIDLQGRTHHLVMITHSDYSVTYFSYENIWQNFMGRKADWMGSHIKDCDKYGVHTLQYTFISNWYGMIRHPDLIHFTEMWHSEYLV